MKTLQEKAAERELLVKEVAALFDKGDALTDNDLTTITAKNAEIKAMDTEIVRLKEIADIQAANAARVATLAQADPAGRPDQEGSARVDPNKSQEAERVSFRRGNPQHFLKIYKGNREKAEKQAFKFGMFLMATVGNNAVAAKWCNANSVTTFKAQAENINDAGGFLVPEEIDTDLIQLREKFGVVRSLFKRVTMKTDSKRVPRRAGGVQAYHLGDNDGIAASTKAWDAVNLVAQKVAALVLYANELSEDAIIDIADDLAYEISWAFSLVEDQDGLLGDGSSKYGGALGVIPKLISTWGVGGGVGLIVASGNGYANSWGATTLADFNRVKGALPRMAAIQDPCWVCSSEYYAAVIERLMVAAGGNRPDTIQKGGDEETFLGKRVVFSQVMPIVPGLQQVPLLYGAFQLGAIFGDRRETTIAMSDQFAFANDQMALRGTERYAINVHDVGFSGNQANPAQPAGVALPGPIVGLINPNA